MGIQDQAPQPLSSALPATPMFSTPSATSRCLSGARARGRQDLRGCGPFVPSPSRGVCNPACTLASSEACLNRYAQALFQTGKVEFCRAGAGLLYFSLLHR